MKHCVYLISFMSLACTGQSAESPATPAPEAPAAVDVPAAVDTPAPAAKAVSAVPGPDAVNAKNCTDLAWLLTHYDISRLASGSSPAPGTGYPVECCAEGVLTEDDSWRCELDWPSSDVVDCSTWSEYQAILAAAHPEGARSEQVQTNLTILTKWIIEKHHCMSE